MMRRRNILFSAAFLIGGGFGCQAILGIDETSFEPDASVGTDASTEAGDATSSVDASVSLSIAPVSGKIVRGSTLDVSITLSGAASSDVVVDANDLPTGVTASPLTISAGASAGTLHLAAASNAALGAATITIGSPSTNAAPLKLLVADPPGTLDSTFDDDGIKIYGEIDGGYGGSAVAIDTQSDGHIIIAGQFTQNAGWQVTRLANDGAMDTTFATNAAATLPSSGYLLGMAVGPDDKVTVAGSVDGNTITVVRLNPDGTGDNAFHVTGSVNITDNAYCQYGCLAYGVAILPDGTAILAGEANAATTLNGLVLHVMNDGSIDPNFHGGAGSYIGATHGSLRNVLLDGAGRIVAAGSFGTTSPIQFYVLRLSAAGAPDSAFGGDGGAVIIASSSGKSEFALDMADRGDAGYAVVGSDTTFISADAIGIVNLDGTDAGSSVVGQPFANDDQFFGASAQDDGKILAVGQGGTSFESVSYLYRLTSPSTLDPTFAKAGAVQFFTDGGTTDPPGIYFRRVKATHDGRILVAGEKQGTGTIVMRFWQ